MTIAKEIFLILSITLGNIKYTNTILQTNFEVDRAGRNVSSNLSYPISLRLLDHIASSIRFGHEATKSSTEKFILLPETHVYLLKLPRASTTKVFD